MTDVRYQGGFAADATVVFALLTDKPFLGAFATQMGASAHKVSVTHRGGHTTVTLTWTVSTDPVPRLFRPFLGGSTFDVVESTAWRGPRTDGSRNGDVTLTARVGTRQGQMRGSLLLDNAADGAQLELDGVVTLETPIARGFAEHEAAQFIGHVLDRRRLLADEWLARGWSPA
jgi:hypothetical protein